MKKIALTVVLAFFMLLEYANVAVSATTETVEYTTGDIGYYSSIALDSNGYVHISYYDNTSGDLKSSSAT